MNQTKQIYKYLQNHSEGITAVDAWMKLGSMRLADKIIDVKKILRIDEKIERFDVRENGKVYALYKLKKVVPEVNTQMRMIS